MRPTMSSSSARRPCSAPFGRAGRVLRFRKRRVACARCFWRTGDLVDADAEERRLERKRRAPPARRRGRASRRRRQRRVRAWHWHRPPGARLVTRKGDLQIVAGPARRMRRCCSQPEEEHLDRPGHGNRSQGTEHTRELGPDQHRDQDHERGEPHRAAVHERLENVILDLLVDDEEHDQDDPGHDRVDEPDRSHDDRGDRRAGQRDQVEDRHEQAERDGVRDSEREQDDGRRHSGDEADQQVSGHVAADGAVDLVADAPPVIPRALGQHGEEAIDPERAFEEHEEGHEDDRHGGDDRGDDPLRDRDRGAGEAEHLRRSTGFDRVPDPLRDVVLRLEEAEAPAAMRDVVDVAGERVGEAVHLADERRDEERRQGRDRCESEQQRDGGRRPALLHALSLEPVDGRVEGEREEHRDQDPDDDVPRDPDDLEQQPDGDRDPEDREDRRGPEADDALLHATRITPESDGPRTS